MVHPIIERALITSIPVPLVYGRGNLSRPPGPQVPQLIPVPSKSFITFEDILSCAPPHCSGSNFFYRDKYSYFSIVVLVTSLHTHLPLPPPRVTSTLFPPLPPRSPKAPDPQADQGTHVLRYGLLPHAHSWQAAGVVAAAAAFNTPLRVMKAPPPQPPPAGAAAPYIAGGMPAFGDGAAAGLAAGPAAAGFSPGGAGVVAHGEYDPMQPMFTVRVGAGGGGGGGVAREGGRWVPWVACVDEGRTYAPI